MTSEIFVRGLVEGQVVADRYEVVRPHRQGGLSVAFEVRDREDDSLLELQLFPGGLFESLEQLQQFAASWEPWTRIDSASVQGVREVLSMDGEGLVLIASLPAGDDLWADALAVLGALPVATALWWHVDIRPFQHLQQGLLYPFTRYVPCNTRVI